MTLDYGQALQVPMTSSKLLFIQTSAQDTAHSVSTINMQGPISKEVAMRKDSILEQKVWEIATMRIICQQG